MSDGALVKFSLCADQLILLIFLGFILPFIEPNTDYSALVYKNCANETFTEQLAAASSHQQTLESLFSELVSHSSQSKFFRTTAGNDHVGISGLYQCRRDITNQDCHGCVAKLPDISNTLCNRAKAANIQLLGCSLRYEATSFSMAKYQLPAGTMKYEAEHKDCSRERAEIETFEELRDSAFDELESEVVIRHGYCTVEREGLRALARCDEEMGKSECLECVKHAVYIAKEQCERAVSGQVSFSQCSVRYLYGRGDWEGFRGGETFPYRGYHEGEWGEHDHWEEHDHHGRELAIILGGGAAAVLIGLILLALIGVARRKDDC